MPAVSSTVGAVVVVAGVPHAVLTLAVGAVGLTTLSVVLILGSCCRKKSVPAPKSKSKTLPRSVSQSVPSTPGPKDKSLQEKFASTNPFEGSERKNPLFRKDSIDSSASGFSGFGKDRKDSIESSFSGFGDKDMSSSGINKAEAKAKAKAARSSSGYTKEDKKNGYIGIVVPEDKSTPNQGKKERDLAGAKARKDAERAAKIAKMKALRANKKEDESKALYDALAVIDALEEE